MPTPTRKPRALAELYRLAVEAIRELSRQAFDTLRAEGAPHPMPRVRLLPIGVEVTTFPTASGVTETIRMRLADALRMMDPPGEHCDPRQRGIIQDRITHLDRRAEWGGLGEALEVLTAVRADRIPRSHVSDADIIKGKTSPRFKAFELTNRAAQGCPRAVVEYRAAVDQANRADAAERLAAAQAREDARLERARAAQLREDLKAEIRAEMEPEIQRRILEGIRELQDARS